MLPIISITRTNIPPTISRASIRMTFTIHHLHKADYFDTESFSFFLQVLFLNFLLIIFICELIGFVVNYCNIKFCLCLDKLIG